MTTLACGPYFSPGLVLASLLVLSLAKYPIYVLFILCFRYRVSTPTPLSLARVNLAALLRTLGGIVVLATIAIFATGTVRAPGDWMTWVLLLAERGVLWFVVGAVFHLRDRRLVGFTLSGVGIDAASDLIISLIFGASTPLGAKASILMVFLAGAAFLVPLFVIGRRPSLKARFFAQNLCRGCGYDLTGNCTGTCPECGTRVDGPALAT